MKFIGKISIKAKVIGLVTILCVFMVIIGLVSLIVLRTLGTEIEEIAEEDIVLIELMSEAVELQLEQAIKFEQIFRISVTLELGGHPEQELEVLEAEFDELVKKGEEKIERAKVVAEEALDKANNDVSREEFTMIRDKLGVIQKEQKDFEDHVHQAFELTNSGKYHEFDELALAIEKEEEHLYHEMEDFLLSIEHFTEESLHKAEKDEKLAERVVIICVISALIIAALISTIILVDLLKRLTGLSKSIAKVADGDLTVEYADQSTDELGRVITHFNRMTNDMRTLIVNSIDISTTVASNSEEMMQSTDEASKVEEQVAVAINDLAVDSTKQAKEAQESNHLLSQLIDEIEVIREGVQVREKKMGHATSIVNKGMETVYNQQIHMDANKKATDNVGIEITMLDEKSNEIGQIVELIRSIADQTNLLALNAAIEAARAGEQGKGFAVVAEEVRKLAEESGNATQKISDLISEIQISVEKAVEEMNNTKSIVNEQETAVKETIESFESTLNIFTEITETIYEEAKAIERVNENGKSVGGSIDSIASLVEENAASTEELAASAEEQTATIQEISAGAAQLSSLANDLYNSIDKFKV